MIILSIILIMAKISYDTEYKLSITEEQKKLLLTLKCLNNFFTKNMPDTLIDVCDLENSNDDDSGETRYHCYFCNILCRETDYLSSIRSERVPKYLCVCDNEMCLLQFRALEKIIKDVYTLKNVQLPIYTNNKSIVMYLSISHHSVNLIFNKIHGLIVFATTTQIIDDKYVPKSDEDHFSQLLKCDNVMDYYCDDFIPIQLGTFFDKN